MQRVDIKKLGYSAIRAVPGSLLVGVVTFICYGLGLNLTTTGFLYLIAVVLQSLLGDFVSSAIVSVIADLCLNFFFVPPLFSLRVSDSSDFWALVCFLVTGLVITRLTTQVRAEGMIAELQRQEMHRLYELAQRLLALDPGAAMVDKSVELFRSAFGPRAVCLYDGDRAELHSRGDSIGALGEKTRAAYLSGQDSDEAISGVLVRRLLAGTKTIGAIGFVGLRDAELTAGPLAALAATMLERARAFNAASHAAAATEAEVFRGAILDALAHEFKTPLATIVTAAGGLREIGPLRAEQLELAEMMETEAARLGLLTSRLLRIARLDREEVKPELELTDIADLVAHLVDQYSKRWTDRKFSVAKTAPSAAVLADAELLRLLVSQLLDNACKYSPAGATVTVSVELTDDSVAVRVWNSGSVILVDERRRIFERFYRGADTRDVAPGSGLGLYVARKIAFAHGGSLDLETAAPAGGGTAFRLTMPMAKSEA